MKIKGEFALTLKKCRILVNKLNSEVLCDKGNSI